MRTTPHAARQEAQAARWVALSVVARECGVSWWSVWRWVQAGRVAVERTESGRYRVPLAELYRLTKREAGSSLCALCGAPSLVAHDCGITSGDPVIMSNETNQRLHRLIAQIYPAAMAQHDRDGSWPTRDGGDPSKREHGQAPFVIDTTRDGQTRLRLTSADGDLVAGVGPNLDEAITVIASKLRVAL